MTENEYEKNHEAMKKWNEQRAIAEKKGLEKFRKLKQLFDEEKKRGKIIIGDDYRGGAETFYGIDHY